MADDDYAYLAGLSAHPKRPGDTSNFNPAFAKSLANAIRQARAAGLNIGLESGFRSPSTLVSQGGASNAARYDAGGNSSHSYGVAGDVSGLDGPNGKITNQWAQIATANGLHNPYGVGDAAEFNHWQLPEQPLEKNPQLLASLKQAAATANIHNVWSAYNSGGGPSRPGTPTPGTPVNDFYHTAMMHESGGKNIPNAAGGWSAAGGYYQFTPPTWAAMRAAHPELNLPANIADANQDQQTAAYHQLVNTNVAALQAANLPINDKNVFMASFLGGGGATKFLSAMKDNPNASAADLFPKEAQANPTIFYANGKPRSLNDVFALQTGKFGTGNTTGFGPNATAAPAVASTTPGTSLSGVAAGALPGFPDKASSDLFTKGLEQVTGKSGGAPGQGGQDQPAQPSPMLGPPPMARNVSPMIPPAGSGAMSPQTYGQTINSLNAPLQWGATPIGASPYAVNLPVGGRQAGAPQPVGAQSQPMGTSLTSIQNMDPQAYQDKLALLYGAQAGGGGSYG